MKVPALSFLKEVVLGTLYCEGNVVCWNIAGVVDNPPAECATDTVTPRFPNVPDPEVELTEFHVAQYNPCELQSEFEISIAVVELLDI